MKRLNLKLAVKRVTEFRFGFFSGYFVCVFAFFFYCDLGLYVGFSYSDAALLSYTLQAVVLPIVGVLRFLSFFKSSTARLSPEPE